MMLFAKTVLDAATTALVCLSQSGRLPNTYRDGCLRITELLVLNIRPF